MIAAFVLAAVTSCGVERWAVKTVSDPSVGSIVLSVKQTSIDSMRSLPVPKGFNGSHGSRYAAEKQVVEMPVLYKGFKEEADQDYHIVVVDPAHPTETMVVEAPDPGCVDTPSAAFKAEITAVRATVTKCFGPPRPAHRMETFKHHISGRVRGIPFFDKIHGQTGVAPNGIELHPLLWVQMDTCP